MLHSIFTNLISYLFLRYHFRQIQAPLPNSSLISSSLSNTILLFIENALRVITPDHFMDVAMATCQKNSAELRGVYRKLLKCGQ